MDKWGFEFDEKRGVWVIVEEEEELEVMILDEEFVVRYESNFRGYRKIEWWVVGKEGFEEFMKNMKG